VDDEPIVVKIVSGFLEESAETLGRAHSADDALELLQNGNFELLIADRFMPGMDGIQLIQQARARQPEIKTILISGVATKPLDKNGGEVADLFMPKPFSKAELLLEIDRLFAAAPRPEGAA
jgi:CheY-like chemotaxis protein